MVQVVELPAERIIHPWKLYQLFAHDLLKHSEQTKPVNYFSGPMSSGGAIRFRDQGQTITTKDVIIANVTFVEKLVTVLEKTGNLFGLNVVAHTIGSRFIPESTVSNPDIKDTKHWQEIDYLLFWLMVISGLEADQAHNFFNSIYTDSRIKPGLLSDHHVSRIDRQKEYHQLQVAATEFFHANSQIIHPIAAVVSLPDSELSLGSTLEQNLAHELDIPVQKISINPNHEAIKSTELINDPVFKLFISLAMTSLPIHIHSSDQPFQFISHKNGTLT